MTAAAAAEAWERLTARCEELLAGVCDYLPGGSLGDHYAAAYYVEPRWGPKGVEALEGRWVFNDDARVTVTQGGVKVSGARLVDVLKMPFWGVPVHDIEPAHAVYGAYVGAAHARAVTPDGNEVDCVVTVVDLRGMGRLADSVVRGHTPLLGTRLPDGKTQGSVVRSWLGRSGVPAANRRRERLARQLYRATGKQGRQALKDIYVSVIRDGYESMPPGTMSTFAVWHGDNLVAAATPPDGYRFPRFADEILGMLSLSVEGSRRGNRPAAWVETPTLEQYRAGVRVDTDSPPDEVVPVLDDPETHPTAPIGVRGRMEIVGVGDWTKFTASRDPAGMLGTGLADGTVPDWLEDAWMTPNIEHASSVEFVEKRLRMTSGLSPRKAQILATRLGGATVAEVAEQLGLNVDHVRREIKAAMRLLDQKSR